jgi:DNA-binding NtrC family response regulator
VRANVLVVGLERALGEDLRRALAGLGQWVAVAPFRSPADVLACLERVKAQLIFCGTESRQYLGLLELLRERGLEVPVVVVSRLPETGDWLDAMEAGAWDYCAAPFEADLIFRIVENAIKYPRALPLAG